MQYLDFEIDVTGGGGGSYTVKVRSPAGEATSSMRFPFDQPTLTNRLQALQIALLRSSMTRRRIASPESRTVQDFGQELWAALFSGDVLSRYEASRQEAKHQQSGIRIKFRCDDPELAALPWEYLFDPVRGDFVALSTSTPLVRYIPLPTSMPPLLVTPPIRILAVAVSPSDLDGLDVERERSRLTAALETIHAKGLVELTWLPGQTWHDFQEALLEGPWHILHFIGHGGFDENRQEGIVAFARPDGKADYKRATSLGRLLGDHESLRLAVLNACESGRSDLTDLFSSTAGTLVRKGTPAVVAMQYEITDEAAIELSRSFYGAIARGIPVDTALTEARKGLATEFEDTLEWGTPVLFLEAPDGVLFNIAAVPVGAAAGVLAAVAAPVLAAAPAVEPHEAPPLESPPPIAPPPEPVTARTQAEPEAVLTPEPLVPVTPPPPPRRPPIAALAAGGGALLLGAVLVANIFGGGGTGGESASPSSSSAAVESSSASSSAPPTEGPTTSAPPTEAVASSSIEPPLVGTGILFQHDPDAITSNKSEIYLLDPDSGKPAEQITHNNSPDRFARWSPDGTLIAFTRIMEDAHGDIWTMDASGGTEDRITGGQDDDWGPDLANDFVYFNTDRNQATRQANDIWRVSLAANGDPTHYLGDRGHADSSPAWSPDGKLMAFSSGEVKGFRAIYTVDVDGKVVRRTFDRAVDRNPRWDNKGRSLVFSRSFEFGANRDIWLLDLESGKPRRITTDPADEGAPVFSPEGARIAFSREVAQDVWHIIVRNLDSGDEQDLTESLGGSSIDPSWR